ncbi:C-C motif chemokine 32b.3 isoform X2 [Pangasianodon hypophthalmus]|uniref:C-C motif chemokine 32b.3 isoform X2 n=1 Tax=Pangasianodon hypophthalmus TaxID=310915 RepID=UPI0023070606|nr:C-C motif chemokine 32b.3 isoform X2 [Pangasianodon hypophthalmus]
MNLFYVLFVCMMSCLCGSEVSWPSFCCLKKNSIKGLPVKNVADCKVQSAGLCPFDAIIIKTHKDRNFCLDPKAEWVIKNVVMKGTDSCDMKRRKKSRGGKRDCIYHFCLDNKTDTCEMYLS